MSVRLVPGLLLVAGGLAAVPASAQINESNIAEVRAAIARDGRARVIVEMTLPDAMTAERARAMSQRADAGVLRARVERNRAAIAARRQEMRTSLTAAALAVDQDYDNLPMLLLRVDGERLERLLRLERVKNIYLDKPLARRQTAPLPTTLLEKVAVRAEDSATPADTAAAAADERARRLAEAPADDIAHALLSSTVTYIGADKAWARGYSGQGVSVAVLDDGIDRNHDMFVGKIVAEACYSTTNKDGETALCPGGLNSSTAVGAASNCTTGNGACRHGSHVAGIAVGNDALGSFTLKGVAWSANLIPVQVFTLSTSQLDCDGAAPCLVAYSSAVLNGLNFAIAQAAATKLAAVNLSLGGTPVAGACDNDVRKPAVDTLRSLGVLTAIAAGNESQLGKVDPPGCISTALTTSSVIITLPDSSTNHAANVDVLAPGVAVTSADINNGYAVRTGSSMATPHAAGAVAILKAAKPSASADEIEAALKSGGIATTLSSWTWSTPRVEVNRALDALIAGATPISGVAVPGVYGSRNPTGTSYLRFFNTDQSAATVTVQVVDDLSGQKVGTWTRLIRGWASPQVAMSVIESEAVPSIVPPASASQFYSLYVNAPFTGFAQHVLYSPQTSILSNVSTCDNGVAASGRYLNNVHTSRIAGYTSYALVHNTGASDLKPTFAVHDARDGTEIGSFSTASAIRAHTSALIRVSDVLETLGRTPDSTQYHVNLILGSAFTGFAQHWVRNEAQGIVTNISAKCDI